jgi:hypothetical protein
MDEALLSAVLFENKAPAGPSFVRSTRNVLSSVLHDHARRIKHNVTVDGRFDVLHELNEV